jgi:hypothetical protein
LSNYFKEPAFQTMVQTWGRRSTPDVSYDADPATGVSMYDVSTGGWSVAGGTSAGAPQWAGLIALADQGRALTGLAALDGASQTIPGMYALFQRGAFFYVRAAAHGTNGSQAGPSYDVVTGLGSPDAATLVPLLARMNGAYNKLTITATIHAGLIGSLTASPDATAPAEPVLSLWGASPSGTSGSFTAHVDGSSSASGLGIPGACKPLESKTTDGIAMIAFGTEAERAGRDSLFEMLDLGNDTFGANESWVLAARRELL